MGKASQRFVVPYKHHRNALKLGIAFDSPHKVHAGLSPGGVCPREINQNQFRVGRGCRLRSTGKIGQRFARVDFMLNLQAGRRRERFPECLPLLGTITDEQKLGFSRGAFGHKTKQKRN
jgi:hypothetical protein